MSNIDY
jgi:hypothetical protein